MDNEILNWLLQGDVSIQYRVHRDLLQSDDGILALLQRRIGQEGWAKEYLSRQNPDGHWGLRLYQPKWTSTFYTLLDLKYFCLPRGNSPVDRVLDMLYTWKRGNTGGINIGRTIEYSDVCVQGMILSYGAWFGMKDAFLAELIDFVLGRVMTDGGWNCEDVHGARRSSVHTTLSVLEGLWEYEKQGGRHRLQEIHKVRCSGEEFLLKHRLYKSLSTGETMNEQFARLTFPHRWRYDILRSMVYFAESGHPWDERMRDALDIIMKKRTPDGTWKMMRPHTGQVHFTMEETGHPSRWLTYFALLVLQKFEKSYNEE